MNIKIPEIILCEHCGNYYFTEISAYIKGSNNVYSKLKNYLKCEVCKAIYDENGEEITLFDNKN